MLPFEDRLSLRPQSSESKTLFSRFSSFVLSAGARLLPEQGVRLQVMPVISLRRECGLAVGNSQR